METTKEYSSSDLGGKSAKINEKNLMFMSDEERVRYWMSCSPTSDESIDE